MYIHCKQNINVHVVKSEKVLMCKCKEGGLRRVIIMWYSRKPDTCMSVERNNFNSNCMSIQAMHVL